MNRNTQISGHLDCPPLKELPLLKSTSVTPPVWFAANRRPVRAEYQQDDRTWLIVGWLAVSRSDGTSAGV